MLLNKLKNAKQDGFTLLEVLLVVAVIAILAGIVIIAINPGKNLGDSRNSQRSADVNTIINAVYQYSLDNNGILPAVGGRTGAVAIGLTDVEICNSVTVTCTGLVDLGVLNLNGKYLVSVPNDPQCPSVCATNGAGYMIKRDANNRLTLTAPDAEQSKTISVTR